MISRIFPGVEGYSFFQGLSLVLFLLVFMGVVIMLFTMQKSHITKMSNLPLDLEEDQSPKLGDHK